MDSRSRWEDVVTRGSEPTTKSLQSTDWTCLWQCAWTKCMCHLLNLACKQHGSLRRGRDSFCHSFGRMTCGSSSRSNTIRSRHQRSPSGEGHIGKVGSSGKLLRLMIRMIRATVQICSIEALSAASFAQSRSRCDIPKRSIWPRCQLPANLKRSGWGVKSRILADS